MPKLTPQEFVKKYAAFAIQVQKEENIPFEAILTRCAIEIGYDPTNAPGNNFFGIKDTDGINGNEQLLDTYEDMYTPTAKFPVIKSIKQLSAKVWRYFVKDYFRKYNTPYESFRDFAVFLKRNSRYSICLQEKDPVKFSECICRQGYATDVNSIALSESVARSIVNITKSLNIKVEEAPITIIVKAPSIDNDILGKV